MQVAVIPRNYAFVGKTPYGDGLSYKSKYAAVGIYCFSDQVLMDGINEKGLTAAAFYFPHYASYTPITAANQRQALSPVDFPNWILTQFASIEEIKAALSSVVIAPTVLQGWGPTPPPMHYVIYDKQGKSIVIEPLNGTLIVYDNTIGVITNSPTFNWHLTNLSNYAHLSPYNAMPVDLNGLQLTPFGQGSGLSGLPGDFTPPSRFVRAAIFSAAAIRSQNSASATNEIFHILNQFDIPKGVVRQSEQGAIDYDYTMLTSVKDPQALKYYFKTYDDQTIKLVDMHRFNLNASRIVSVTTHGTATYVDISSQLHSAH